MGRYDPHFEDEDIPSLDDGDALHTVFPVSRHPKLETFDSVASVLEQLEACDYTMIVERIVGLCTPEEGGERAVNSNADQGSRQIDVPDIYRYGFEIKRKGGVASPK